MCGKIMSFTYTSHTISSVLTSRLSSIYFKDDNINKLVRIRKYLAKHNGDIKKIKADAKALVLDMVPVCTLLVRII
jgi:hypothetical protein